MTSQSFKVEGLRELDAALAELGKSLGRGVMRRAAVKALTPMIADARARVEASTNGTGALAESLAVSTTLSKRQRKEARRESKSYFEMYAGASALPHAHLLEFGTGERAHKSGKSVGKMPPEPFMRPAWDANKGDMAEAVGRELWTDIEKTAARKAKRDAKRAAQG